MLDGTSGHLQFDSNGSRSNYSLELSEVSFVFHSHSVSVRSSSVTFMEKKQNKIFSSYIL